MSTAMLLVNIALVAVVAAIVALPAVLIPSLLDRDARPRVATPVRQAVPERRWAPEAQRSADAA